MKRPLIVLPAALVLLALTGCSGQTVSGPPQSSAPASSAAATPATSAPDDDASEDTADQVAAFGQTLTYSDGLAITVTDEGSFHPDQYAAGGEGYSTHRLFRIRITNETGDTFDPSLVQVSASGGDSDGDAVFDSAHKLDGTPDGRIRNGKSVSFNYGFGLDGTSDLTVTVTPDYSHDDAVFGDD